MLPCESTHPPRAARTPPRLPGVGLCAWLLGTTILLAYPASQGLAQEVLQEDEVIHWAYGAFLGTGRYRLDDSREVYVVNIPMWWTWREPRLDDDGTRHWGAMFEAPLGLGLHRLDGIGEVIDADNVGTVAFTPGVELDWPWNERLMLRAYGHLGYGWATDGGDSAWMHDLGLRARYGFRHQALDWALVGEVFRVGYETDQHVSSSLGGLMAGAQFSHPLPRNRYGLALRWDLSWRWLGRPLQFVQRDTTTVDIEDEWQLSASLARPGPGFRVGPVRFEQFGLSWRFSSDGNFEAITLVFSPLFDR